MKNNIAVLDTSIASQNIGDEIIMDAVYKELNDIFNQERFFKLPTHEIISKSGLALIRKSKFGVLGGSNILSSYMNEYKQWKIYIPHTFFIKHKIVTMGVGWRDYQHDPNLYTKILLRKILNSKYLHSVRDSYTEERLKGIGFKNVINTACPTLWQLTMEHCKKIPHSKAKNVVFTLTDYNKDFEKDKIFISKLIDNYEEVYYWIQGVNDLEYLQSFNQSLINKIKIIPPRLASYDDFLDNINCDYIGTRLHGGIRALQKKKRTIIIGIDNRALEKKKDFNLTVLNRENILDIEELISQDFVTSINLPLNNIEKWRNQFKNDFDENS